MIVFFSWFRFLAILFVIESLSKLLITIVKMMGSATTFLFILFFYLVIMGTIAMTLFQESSITYSTPIFALRTVFDAMCGSYSYDISPEYNYYHTVFMIVHIFFSNIFMLNYLVAILSTVYEQMMETGDFTYKCYRYKYIERYNIAFQDQWGYSELVIHPPPINMALAVLLLGIFDKNTMQSTSKMYSMVNFWLENLVLLTYQLIYELLLVPIIYLRVMMNVITLADWPTEATKLLCAWIPGGLFYLLYGVGLDMFYFFKILCDYKQDDDTLLLKQEEDRKQDTIVILKEIVEVLKIILFIIR